LPYDLQQAYLGTAYFLVPGCSSRSVFIAAQHGYESYSTSLDTAIPTLDFYRTQTFSHLRSKLGLGGIGELARLHAIHIALILDTRFHLYNLIPRQAAIVSPHP